MSHPMNGDQSDDNRQGGSLGQGWEDQEANAAPFDAQQDATQVIPSARQEPAQQGSGHQQSSQQNDWQDGSRDAPAQGSEAADVAGSANSGQSYNDQSYDNQGYGNEDFAAAEPSYGQQHDAEPAGYSAPDPRGPQSGQQGWSQPAGRSSQANQGDYGQPQGSAGPAGNTQDGQGGFGQQAAQQPGQQGGWGQQAAQQPGQQGGWGQQSNPQGQQSGNESPSAASQAQAQVGRVMSGAGDGVGALLSDFQFKKSLTGRLSSLVFLVTVVWAVLSFLSNLVYNFGSQTSGNISIKHMGTGSALIHTLTDLVLLVLVVGVARILLELAVNVARIANRDKK